MECHPDFRLYLHTATLPQYVPPELAAYTTLVYHQTARDSIRQELLDRLYIMHLFTFNFRFVKGNFFSHIKTV